MKEPEPLQQVDRTYVRFQGRKLSYFAGCDYFRLASHPQVVAALRSGVKKYGLNVAASRMTTGNHVLYRELEAAVADFFGAQSAAVVSTGYVTNLVAAQALAGRFSHALVDDGVHPSLSDAARFLDCPVLRFKSRDPAALAAAVRRCGPESSLVVLTDGMFSNDGSAAPLADYLKVLPRDALLLVDDAHGGGVLGRTGKGAVEHAGISRARVIQTVTLSKAFGAYGGAILGTARFRQSVLDRSRMFVGSTPLPLPLANAALTGVRILKAHPGLRTKLMHNAAYVKAALREAGMPLPDAPGPIVRVVPQRPSEAARLQRALLRAGIFPSYIKYPGGPASGNFRFVISSEHSRAQLDGLIRVLGRYAQTQGKA
ncbi:MAG TPA: pyridoxal phosphate-dependent aminotransferase family protein [Candidatus Acidoferrum sp.]|nr:pyridoxal phosphate-dependent aminotransferase family protein [Candidatus Acidoferrum sp.]